MSPGDAYPIALGLRFRRKLESVRSATIPALQANRMNLSSLTVRDGTDRYADDQNKVEGQSLCKVHVPIILGCRSKERSPPSSLPTTPHNNQPPEPPETTISTCFKFLFTIPN